MKFAVLALTLLLAVASQAAAVPEEPSEIRQRFVRVKLMVAQLKDILDRTIAVSPDSHLLETPSALSHGLGGLLTHLQTNEEAIVASISATQEMFSQMSRAGELSGELDAAVANLDRVLKEHLAEYNVLLTPIIQDFKQMSMQFSDVAAPKIANLRNEFRTNTEETINALGPIVRIILKMGSNLRESINMHVEEYRFDQAHSAFESLPLYEQLRRRQEMEAIGEEVKDTLNQIFQTAFARAPSS